MCSEASLVKRIAKDILEGIRDTDCIERSLINLKLYKNIDSIKIYTDNKTIDKIVSEIFNIVKS